MAALISAHSRSRAVSLPSPDTRLTRQMVGLSVSRKGGAADIVTVGANGLERSARRHCNSGARIWPEGEGESGEIVEDQNLAIALGTGADADGGGCDCSGDAGGDFARNAFQHQRGNPGSVERGGVGEQRVDGMRGFALHLVAAHAVHGLGSEPDVSDDRNLGVDDAADERNAGDAALDFHRFGAAFLDEAHGVLNRLRLPA